MLFVIFSRCLSNSTRNVVYTKDLRNGSDYEPLLGQFIPNQGAAWGGAPAPESHTLVTDMSLNRGATHFTI